MSLIRCPVFDHFLQLAPVPRCIPIGIIVEIDIHIFSIRHVGPHSPCVFFESGFRIAGCIVPLKAVPPHVHEIGGNRKLVDERRPVCHAEAYIVGAAKIEYLIRDSALVSEFQGVSHGVAIE